MKLSVLRPFKLIKRKIKKNLFLKSKVAKAIRTKVKEVIKVVKKSPSEPSDYVRLGGRYVAKRFGIVLLAAVIGVYFLMTLLVLPFARGRLYVPTASLEAPYLNTFTGKIKLTNRSGVLVYEGEMVEGKCNGSGSQYDDEGNLIYQGEFSEDTYTGDGALYDSEGVLIYKGEMLSNQFDGYGKRYYYGELVYEGDFSKGLYNGSGSLYENGKLKYAGNFVQGIKNGYGITYFESGMIAYTGYFENGHYQGEGTLYNDSGQRIYTGAFSNGVFEGNGTLYFDSGQMAYEGDFSMGMYQGTGKSFDEQGRLIYEGEFVSGDYSGLGTAYFTDNAYYEGYFLEGLFDGEGAYYDQDICLYQGLFSKGHADIASLIGADSSVLTSHFGDTGNVLLSMDTYSIIYEDKGIMVSLTLPSDTTPPMITAVYVKHEALYPDLLDEEMTVTSATNPYGTYGLSTFLNGTPTLWMRSTLKAEALITRYSLDRDQEDFVYYRVTERPE